MSESFSRRDFTRSVALSAAPAFLPSLSAADTVNTGIIGVGTRGNYLVDRLYAGSGSMIKMLAICDTYEAHRARAKDKVQTKGNNTPDVHVDYQDLLKNPDISTVVIATPEHLHHSMTIAALKAGKNVYIEKPLAHTIEEGEEILKVARQTKRLIQVGTQNRSNSLYQDARKMVQEGMIGECHYVRAFWYRNALNTGAPAWRYTVPPDTNESNTDWKRFLGPAKNRPFDKQRYFQWRLYSDYSGGISTDLLVHQTDITNFVLGKTVPDTCMASGGVYRWSKDDDRDVPDTFSAIYDYKDRFHLNYSCYLGNEQFGYGEQFCGDEGTLEVLNRQQLVFSPEKFYGKPPAHVAARKAVKIDRPGNDNLAVEAHLRNLIEAVQGKTKELIAPVEVGQQAAVGGHMATLSLRAGKKVIWDERTRKARFV